MRTIQESLLRCSAKRIVLGTPGPLEPHRPEPRFSISAVDFIHSQKDSLIMSNTCQTTRRRFLQGVAAAGAASIVLPSANRAFGYQAANDRPVFATIGL